MERRLFGCKKPRRRVFIVGESRQMPGRGIIGVVVAEDETLPSAVVIPILDHLQGRSYKQELFEIKLCTISEDEPAFDESSRRRSFLVREGGRRHKGGGNEQLLQDGYVVEFIPIML